VAKTPRTYVPSGKRQVCQRRSNFRLPLTQSGKFGVLAGHFDSRRIAKG
jgi:hypothetical protein